ncbi:SRPBCC family protein [Ulvibacter antarcticus]|uniref:Activator of Hsp90 ATPase-like protein n=1 Tax=Ulvibacter antarcticus TaxID=442714 RepID=A0A3L9YIP1_9FLAO|nr:SRPBCC domain-containing protein [Ulvibacter antarcticus]RMA58015.1 activator of Hsp90 ATPase-like protein [Ulvibacter antarcticus]
MKDFDWTKFTRKIAINATIKELYDAWTTASEIERWFLERSVYKNSENKEIPKTKRVEKGDSYVWSWYLYEPTEDGKITKANGKDHLQFTFAGDCLVDVVLTEKEGKVIVTLTQSNIPVDDNSKKGIRLGCDSGWSFYLVNLKSVYEGGVDLRNKDESLKGMLNA